MFKNVLSATVCCALAVIVSFGASGALDLHDRRQANSGPFAVERDSSARASGMAVGWYLEDACEDIGADLEGEYYDNYMKTCDMSNKVYDVQTAFICGFAGISMGPLAGLACTAITIV